MNDMLDTLWDQIMGLSYKAAALLDIMLGPLDSLGPEFVIFFLALVSVAFSTFLNVNYSTKRHRKLEKEFKYWFNLRKEAMDHGDKEKGKAMAKNIDQAKLNRAYYDYFFEGLMKSLLTIWLPILLTLSYINLSYNPAALHEKFGSKALFVIGGIEVSAVFWFFVCLVVSFILKLLVKHLYKSRFSKSNSQT